MNNVNPTILAAIAPHLGTLGRMPQHPEPTRDAPTGVDLVNAIAKTFKVSAWEAFDWLSAMDLDSASDALIDQDRANIPTRFLPWGHVVARPLEVAA